MDCYDIYGLTDNRDAATIEKFLGLFFDRRSIESRKGDTLVVVPRVSLLEKHQMFTPPPSPKDRDAWLDYQSEITTFPTYETIPVDTLSQAISLALGRSQVSITLYVPNPRRSDLRCLSITFTEDDRLVLGVTLDEVDTQRVNNLPKAEAIERKLQACLPLRLTSIQFETSPAENEADFIAMKKLRASIDKLDTKRIRRWQGMGGSAPIFHYFYFRDHRHRQFRNMVGKTAYAPNLVDYFTLANAQGRIIKVLSRLVNKNYHEQVRDPSELDATKLPYLHYLFDQGSPGFLPVSILKVAPASKIDTVEKRLWLPETNPLYEGIRAARLTILDTYRLTEVEDLRRLAGEGFFRYDLAGGHNQNIGAYTRWLVRGGYAELYVRLVADQDISLRASTPVLEALFGKREWPVLPGKVKTRINELKGMLLDKCRSGQWSVSQVADVLKEVVLSDVEIKRLLEAALQGRNTEVFSYLYSRFEHVRLEPSCYLKEIMDILANGNPSRQALGYLLFFLQVLELEWSTFCDYPLLLKVAAIDEKVLLNALLELLPEEEWQNNRLLHIGLSTDNHELLGRLAPSEKHLNKVRAEAIHVLSNTGQDYRQLLKEAVAEPNYFQVAHLVPLLEPKDLVTPLLEAARVGLLGIVKILIEKGRVSPDSWFNYPIKFANQGGYSPLKKYLLSNGVRDEVFQ